jgi:HEAT repeat protein
MDVRRQSVQALGKFGSQAGDAVPLLVQLLPESSGDDDEDVANDADLRGCAAEALGDIRCNAAIVVPALASSLRDSDSNARKLKTEALGKFGNEARAAVPALTRLLDDDDQDVRQSATNALLAITPKTK